jgi:hypothetical protein
MEFNDNTPYLCADLVLPRVCEFYAADNKLTNTEALRHIMTTKTYAVLQDPDSKLWGESAESLYYTLKAEDRGDWAEWYKI